LNFSNILLAVAAIAIGPGCLTLRAHHSFAADYDAAKPFTLQGTVIQVDWMNPHVHFSMDVKDESGKITHWEFELGSPNTLMRSGWTRNTLRIGDEITVKGSRAKDSSNQGNATTIVSGGRIILSGAPAGQEIVAR
jgi:hypothetical protein